MRIILTEAHVDNKSILRILTQSKQINTSDPKYSQYNQLATWASSNQQKIKNIDLTTIPISDKQLITANKLPKRFTTLGHTLLSLKNLMDQQGHYDSGNSVSQLIQKTTLELLEFLKDGKVPNKEPELYEGMDWTAEKAKRQANTNGKPISEVLVGFYNDYYKIEYAGLTDSGVEDPTGIVARLKSLDKILIPEFNKLGYNPDVNPLAQFIKILIKLDKENKSGIFDKLTTNTYGAIHNSFVNGNVKGNTLGNYNEKHLLFCEDLYNYKGTTIVEYLRLFKETLATAEAAEDELNQDKWTLATKIFIQQDLSTVDSQDKDQQKTFVNNVALLLKKADVLLPTKSTAKLRSIKEIKELYTYIFKTAPSTEKKAENKAIEAVVSGAKTKGVILDMIYHIASSEIFEKTYPERAQKLMQELASYNKDFVKLEDCRKILALYEEDLAAEDLSSLITKLVNAYDH